LFYFVNPVFSQEIFLTMFLFVLRFFIFFSLLSLFSTASFAVSLEPLGIQDAQLLKKDTGEFRVGLSYASGLHNHFQKRDLNRRIAQIPSVALYLGMAERVEGQLHYNFLHLQEEGQGTKWGSGDLSIAFKIRLFQETSTRPALALRFATKLPNADDKKDLGTDEADIFSDFLVTRNFHALTAYLNLGLAILGAPGKTTTGQDDLLKYAAGLHIPFGSRGAGLLLSVEGLTSGKLVNERGALRAGFRIPLKGITWDIGGSLGYTGKSEDWSLQSGLTTRFDFPETW
jgi:hypothetical protein